MKINNEGTLVTIMIGKKRFLPLTGFTLFEIVIALLILSIGLIGILTLYPIGFNAVAKTIDITKATFLAQTVMEEVKKRGYDGASLIQAGSDLNHTSYYPNFEYTVTVSDAGVGLKQVDVEVYWPAGESDQKSIGLSTYIADYEP